MRRLHRRSGPSFGHLLHETPAQGGGVARVRSRYSMLRPAYLERGGSVTTADRVGRFPVDRRDVIDRCSISVLCHHDLIAGNLLLTDGDRPRLSGVIDFERAAGTIRWPIWPRRAAMCVTTTRQ